MRPLCQVLRVKQSDGAGVQSDGVGLQSDGVGLQTLEVTVHRGERRLGMMLDDDNIVLEIKPNSPAQGLLQAGCLLYTSPSPRDQRGSRMPSSA